jgi:predicted alpha/beta superfamily hydrolase
LLKTVWAFICASLLAVAPAAAETPSGTPIIAGTSYVLHSKVLGDDREVNVWLPAGYAKGTTRYSVLYVLDGARDQDFSHIAALGQLGELSWTYETLIVVGVQTRKRITELTPPAHDPRYLKEFPANGGAEQFRRFLHDEVIPFVDGNFRTGPRRTLVGESLAGLFVTDTALEAPESFDDYIAVSPSLWWDARALTRAAPALLARARPGAHRLYLTIGDEGPYARKAMDELTAALGAHASKGFTSTFVDRSASETHATIYHAAVLDALRRFYAAPPDPPGALPWYYTEEGGPPKAGP